MTEPAPSSDPGNPVPEGLIAVVFSFNLKPGLVITPTRVIGFTKWSWTKVCEAYLGPNSNATDEQRNNAIAWAKALTKEADFELQKDSIRRVVYRRPGWYSSGHVTFDAETGEKIVMLKYLSSNPAINTTLKVLVPALEAFAKEKLYNEKTGNLLVDDIREKGFWKV